MSGTGRGRGDASELIAGPHRDSRRFTATLWAVHGVLFGLGLAGLALKPFLPELAGVGTAGAILLWLVSGTAIVDRARLRSRPGVGQRVVAAGASVLAAGAGVVVVLLVVAPGVWLVPDAGSRILVTALATFAYFLWLVPAYRARLFRWGRW